MFAITIGEVGLQVAAVIQAHHRIHYLPAYSHLILGAMVVAMSWVGWSVSVAPGARKDVQGIFQWEFLVLLLDVSLVITYFILVRTVDFGKEPLPPRIEPASTVALWVLWIFCQYLAWDVLTKIIIYLRKPDGQWKRLYGARMLPTLLCVIFAFWIWRSVQTADTPHSITADAALLSLVLLFRALKDFVSGWLPRDAKESEKPFLTRTFRSLVWTALCLTGMILGTLTTACSWRLPDRIVKEIQTPVANEHNDTPQPTQP